MALLNWMCLSVSLCAAYTYQTVVQTCRLHRAATYCDRFIRAQTASIRSEHHILIASYTFWPLRILTFHNSQTCTSVLFSPRQRHHLFTIEWSTAEYATFLCTGFLQRPMRIVDGHLGPLNCPTGRQDDLKMKTKRAECQRADTIYWHGAVKRHLEKFWAFGCRVDEVT